MKRFNKLLTILVIIFSFTVISESRAITVPQGRCVKMVDYQGAKLVNISLGRIIVKPDVNSGDVIHSKTFVIPGTEKKLMECTYAALNYGSDLALTSSNSKIYKTNLPEIGISFTRVGRGGGNMEEQFPTSWRSGSQQGSITDSTMILIVKLHKIGSGKINGGVLDGGEYSYYGFTGKPEPIYFFKTYMTEEGTTIVTPPCSLKNSGNKTVKLNPVSRLALKEKGAVAGELDFDISFTCSGGSLADIQQDPVYITFDGQQPEGMLRSSGVLKNELEDQSNTVAAMGVGIQVLNQTSNGNQPIEFQNKYHFGILQKQSEQDYIISKKYTARYYRYGDNISAGKVESKMVFNLTYD